MMLVAVDITVGVVADRLMEKLPYSKEDLAKDNYRLHQLNSEVVIIGSSRGCNHYVTQQLSDSLDAYFGKHLSIYNAAIAGKTANSNSCAAEVILSRYRPRLVIYDLSESQLCDDNQGADIEFSAPFYWTDTIVRRYLDDIGLKERILMKSSMYRYSGKLLRILSCYMSPSVADDGYKPKFGTAIDTTKAKNVPKVSETAKELDTYTVSNFENVLKKYTSEKVPLVIVCSPHFRPKDNNKRLAELCYKYGVPFIDFYDTPKFNSHPELFYNGNHMNDDGAHAFTALFFEQLKTFLPIQDDEK
ncbi:MAG: hypothetical protein IJP75_11100 [Bacteroidaceae bacterium]|nr:hypothetical protein [Bacteroidaceae bacterium]